MGDDAGVVRLPAFLFAVAMIGASAGTGALTPAPPPLLYERDLRDIGAFRLPESGGTDQTTFEWGGTALAFDPQRQSLWLVGHDQQQRIAEVSIPTPGMGSLDSLPRADLRTPWIDTTWRRQVLHGSVKIGGILPLPNGSKVISAFAYYDGAREQTRSHFLLAADGTVTGPVQLGNVARRAGFVSGWMVPIPEEWQAPLGGKALTGNGTLPVIGRTSLGPAASVFDPADVGVRTPVPIAEVLGYPITQPTLGRTNSSGALFNGSTNVGGLVFPAGTRSVLFFQRNGTGPVCYKNTGPTSCHGTGGYFAPPYKVQVLAYDVEDLIAVRKGRKRSWQIVPYSHWTIPVGNQHVRGVAYDPATRRIFLSIARQDGRAPLIRVLTISSLSAEPTP